MNTKQLNLKKEKGESSTNFVKKKYIQFNYILIITFVKRINNYLFTRRYRDLTTSFDPNRP